MRKTALIVAFSGLLAGSMAHGTLCGSILSSLNFINEKYAALKREPKADRTAGTIRLLNSTFLPLITKLSSTVHATSEQELNALLRAKESASPIQMSPYIVSMGARQHVEVDLRVARIEIPGSDNTQFSRQNYGIMTNAENGVAKFGLNATGQLSAPYYREVPNPGMFGAANEFLWVPASSEQVSHYGGLHRTLSLTITPIGYYGRHFSETLLRTTQIMIELASAGLKEESKSAYLSASELLKVEAARGHQADKEKTPVEMIPLSATIEGILSFHQMVSSVLGEAVPGAKTGPEALHDFVFNGKFGSGLTSELTSRLPMGLIGPMALTGAFFKDSLERTSSGQLVLTENLRQQLKKIKEDQKERSRRVCPMSVFFRSSTPEISIENTGLQTLAEAYWWVFQSVNQSYAVAH